MNLFWYPRRLLVTTRGYLLCSRVSHDHTLEHTGCEEQRKPMPKVPSTIKDFLWSFHLRTPDRPSPSTRLTRLAVTLKYPTQYGNPWRAAMSALPANKSLTEMRQAEAAARLWLPFCPSGFHIKNKASEVRHNNLLPGTRLLLHSH